MFLIRLISSPAKMYRRGKGFKRIQRCLFVFSSFDRFLFALFVSSFFAFIFRAFEGRSCIWFNDGLGRGINDLEGNIYLIMGKISRIEKKTTVTACKIAGREFFYDEMTDYEMGMDEIFF